MSDNPLKPLDDAQVEGIAGGYLFNAMDGTGRVKKPYEVIDDEGDVVARFSSRDAAISYAEANGYSRTWLNTEELQQLRESAGSQ